jgi:hypothetical protein
MAQQSQAGRDSRSSCAGLWTRLVMFLAIMVLPLFAGHALYAQTASTGALAGTVTDATGAVVPGAQLAVTNTGTGQAITVTSNARGNFLLPLLEPGTYAVDVTKEGFKASDYDHVAIRVTETETLNVTLQVGAVSEKITVDANPAQLNTTDAQLGNVIDGRYISNLPLASRNYLQIIGLNPGVSAELTNASELGPGSAQQATGSSGFSSNGAATQDNNFQMNGIGVNDSASEGRFTGGVPIPNPDTLQEFNVVTGPYDASNGRDSGANVDVVTKTGGNDLHGSLFEYFRNNDMNANDYFRKQLAQPRGVLKQNQFGGTIGGHILKNKLFYFGSYQGTRQRNGLDPSCSDTAFLPLLTNDRSAAGLGAVFGGQRGLLQNELGGVGPAVASNGSNINPVALNVLQRKLPDGTFLVPTPQAVNPGGSAANPDTEGVSVYSVACPYTEDQYMANGDYVQNDKSSLQFRYFMSNSNTTRAFPGDRLGGDLPGFPATFPLDFKTASITHTYAFKPQLINQLIVGYNRSATQQIQQEQFSWSDIGSTVPAFVNNIPNIGISSVGLGGNAENTIEVQNTYSVQDSLAWDRGRNNIRVGGNYVRGQINSPYLQDLGGALYPTFADFLLGLDATDNGTAAAGFPVSNEELNLEIPGDLSRFFRFYDASLFFQDNIKLTKSLTVNVGLRFEHLGDFSAQGGRNTNVDPAMLNPNPPAGGTLQGYIVPSNYPGTPPQGVTKGSNTLGIEGLAQNPLEPRFGFAWQLPGTQKLVLRGGYGTYRGLYGANGLAQSIASPPFTYLIEGELTSISNATLQNPFPQAIPALPSFTAAVYSPDTAQSFDGLAQDIKPPFSQHFSLDLQTQLTSDILFDLAYAGAVNNRLIETNLVNQANLASPSSPIRGETTNTLNNITLRAPYEGWGISSFAIIRSNGRSNYNSLQASLTKRFSHGLQFIAAYTWARDLADVTGQTVGGGFGGSLYGDQHNLHASYGPDLFIRPQRFVASYVYDIPYPGRRSSLGGRVLGGWSLAGVTTIQSGHPLPAVNGFDSTNIYGITTDRPDYVPGCAVGKSGPTKNRLNQYFNTACFKEAKVIGDDGIGTDFGNAPVGNIHGPGQFNTDATLGKSFLVPGPHKEASLIFKADFFNVFNHPAFGDPNTDFEQNSNTGQIFSTVANPRIIQLSLRYAF